MRNPTPRRRSTRGKAANASEVREFTDIPNIGPSISQDFALLGFSTPSQLVGQDPCVADVFIAAVRFMEGSASVPWWHYTAERKQAFKQRQ